MIHRVDMELAGFDSGDHLIREVELLGVGAGQQDALFACQTVDLAHPEEAFDLLVDAANSLHIAKLVDCTRYRKVLVNGLAGEGREQGTQTGQRSAVTINFVIGLLEHQVGGERRGVLGAKLVGEVAVNDHHRLGMDMTS